MNNPAMPMTSTTPATCPKWCTTDHRDEQLVPDEHGWWNVLHLSTPVSVNTAETLPADAVVELSVQLQHYVSEAHADPRDLLIWVRANSGYSGERPVDFTITARQGLRFIEVLLPLVTAVLAEESTTLEVTR